MPPPARTFAQELLTDPQLRRPLDSLATTFRQLRQRWHDLLPRKPALVVRSDAQGVIKMQEDAWSEPLGELQHA